MITGVGRANTTKAGVKYLQFVGSGGAGEEEEILDFLGLWKYLFKANHNYEWKSGRKLESLVQFWSGTNI